MNYQDEPYALKTLDEQKRRADMLDQPHIKPLVEYLAAIVAEHNEKSLPCFDPCDGGINAKVLFLLEAPGPKAVGSTFISRNNPDPTARNFCNVNLEAGINRQDTIIWNIVPWYVGEGKRIRAVNKDDINEALPYLKDLIDLLPNLKVIVLVGKKSQSAKSRIRELTSAKIVDTHHPSAQVFNVWPEKRDEMKADLVYVASLIRDLIG